MLPTISIVILVMAYVGILQHAGLMQWLIKPITSKLKSFGSLSATTVASGGSSTCLLPDQYPAIALSCKMYGDSFEDRRAGGGVEQYREFERGYHVGSPSVEHVLDLYGHHSRRVVRGISPLCVFLRIFIRSRWLSWPAWARAGLGFASRNVSRPCRKRGPLAPFAPTRAGR